MKINCAKCAKHIANVVEPSAIKKGASLYGLCYECKTDSLRNGGSEDFGSYLNNFLKGFAKYD